MIVIQKPELRMSNDVPFFALVLLQKSINESADVHVIETLDFLILDVIADGGEQGGRIVGQRNVVV